MDKNGLRFIINFGCKLVTSESSTWSPMKEGRRRDEVGGFFRALAVIKTVKDVNAISSRNCKGS
jgi:hypothetical protein